jgi:hypothetical protein
MPVAYASTGTQTLWGNGTTTVSHSHNIVGNALIVSVYMGYYQQTNPSVVSASINGVPLTMLRQQNYWWASQGSQSTHTAVLGMLNPPTGPQTITLTVSNPNFYGTGMVNSVSYSGVSSFGTVTFGAVNNSAATVTSQYIPTGSMCFNAFQGYKYNAPATLSAYNQTTRANTFAAFNNSMSFLMGDAQGAGGKITFTATSAGEAWYGVTVPLLEKPTATVRGTANAVLGTSVTIPSHSVGDLIVIFGYLNGLSAPPTAPTAAGTVPAWVPIQSGGGNSNGGGAWYFVATATNHTSGTWGSCTALTAAVIQGAKTTSPIGGFALSAVNTGNSVFAPVITQSVTDGSSCLLYFYGHRNCTAWGAAPTGFTRAIDAFGTSGVRLNIKDDTTSDGAATQTNTGNGGSLGQTIEILAGTATVASVPTNQFFQMF